MTDELILNHDDLRNLHRHYINLTCVDSGEPAKASNGGNPKRYNFSAFVVDVEVILLAITAGHVFAELRQAVRFDPDGLGHRRFDGHRSRVPGVSGGRESRKGHPLLPRRWTGLRGVPLGSNGIARARKERHRSGQEGAVGRGGSGGVLVLDSGRPANPVRKLEP